MSKKRVTLEDLEKTLEVFQNQHEELILNNAPIDEILAVSDKIKKYNRRVLNKKKAREAWLDRHHNGNVQQVNNLDKPEYKPDPDKDEDLCIDITCELQIQQAKKCGRIPTYNRADALQFSKDGRKFSPSELNRLTEVMLKEMLKDSIKNDMRVEIF